MVLRLQNRCGKQRIKKALKCGWYPGKDRLGTATRSEQEPRLCLYTEAIRW